MFTIILILMLISAGGVGGAYYFKYEPVVKFINDIIGKEDVSPSPSQVPAPSPAPASAPAPTSAPSPATSGQEGYTMTEYYRYN